MLSALMQFAPVKWALRHPRLSAWIALSVGFNVLLLIEVDEAVTPPQLIALMVACVLVAGVCIWIVSWEDDDDSESPDSSDSAAKKT